ncbi:MAG: acyl-CoA thioesterase [Endozoicomonas sp.]
MARVQIELPEQFHFSIEIPIRVGDINKADHLGNDALIGFINEAWIQFMHHKELSTFEVNGLGFVMADIAVIYQSEGFYGETLRVDVAPDNLHQYGCDIVYRVTEVRSSRPVAKAKTALMMMDYNTRMPANPPETLKTRLFS